MLHTFSGLLLCTLMLAACGQHGNQAVDRLNEAAYAFHYRNLDSTRFYANAALAASAHYSDGYAEALNHLAFVDLVKMNYAQASKRLTTILSTSENQLELAIADIQQMRLCQRESRNKEFYEYQESAQRRLSRIKEDEAMLNGHQLARLSYARSEYAIVSSTYYYYVGLYKQSADMIRQINPYGAIQRDTAQLLNYYYNIGSGGILPDSDPLLKQHEFDYLMRCYVLSQESGYDYWEAQALQALSEHLQNTAQRDTLFKYNPAAIVAINTDFMPDTLLAGNLAQRALNIFTAYDDVYQIAGANRTLAECYWQIKDYRSALICLQRALYQNKAINLAPDLVASIREQLCLVYSAVNDKKNSDINRNIYLDLQEQTRQDRQLEARAAQLNSSAQQLTIMTAVVVVMIIVVSLLLLMFARMRRRSDRLFSMPALLEPLQQWQRENEQLAEKNEEHFEEIAEQTDVARLHLTQNKERNLEQRAKVQLVNSILPFIDRMVNEVNRLMRNDIDDNQRTQRLNYIAELTDSINDYNTILTQWIQMRQGEVSLRIENFQLAGLFDIVKHSEMGFRLKGIQLDVKPTTCVVKADRILTLFMINTIADNARKFTPKGGRVTISAKESPDYVEISVADNGPGMDETTLSHIFDRTYTGGHGFGLKNCNGIIEKYKKMSRLFNACMIKAESQLGKGTRIFFRLPVGRLRMVIALLLLMAGLHTTASAKPQTTAKPTANATTVTGRKAMANRYADSAYLANVNSQYKETLRFADSCHKYVSSNDTTTLLDISNETAVAALALHQWDLYHKSNQYYTRLFRQASADSQLPAYVRSMQRNNVNKTVAVALLVILLIVIFPAYYFLYYRRKLNYRFCVERINQMNRLLLSDASDEQKLEGIEALSDFRNFHLMPEQKDSLNDVVGQIREALKASINSKTDMAVKNELAQDELNRLKMDTDKLYISNNVLDNCLSTLKHETMYYPSRIRQLIDSDSQNLQAIKEVVDYYHALYEILSEQAMRQVHTPRIDGNTIAYLLDILRHCNNGNKPRVSLEQLDANYMRVTINMDQLTLTDDQATALFTPQTVNIKLLLCRQIVREMGEVTNLRACGITATRSDSGTSVIITMPWRYHTYLEAQQPPRN